MYLCVFVNNTNYILNYFPPCGTLLKYNKLINFNIFNISFGFLKNLSTFA
jgi:hypothetical protein